MFLIQAFKKKKHLQDIFYKHPVVHTFYTIVRKFITLLFYLDIFLLPSNITFYKYFMH